MCCPEPNIQQDDAEDEFSFRMKEVKQISRPVLQQSVPQTQNISDQREKSLDNFNSNIINRPDCGLSSYNEEKKTNNQEFPWMVQLRFRKYDTENILGCSGTLITERHVLTVASCLTKTFEL